MSSSLAPSAKHNPELSAPFGLRVGDKLREAIRQAEIAGCATYGVLAVERLTDGPGEPEVVDGRLVAIERAHLSVPRLAVARRPATIDPRVWGALIGGGDSETSCLLYAAAWSSRKGATQLRQLAAAALADIDRQLAPAIGPALGYSSAGVTHHAMAAGRKLLAGLGAWPWACFAEGRLPFGWTDDADVRHAWACWRAREGVSEPASAGWCPHTDALAPAGRRRRVNESHVHRGGRPASSPPADIGGRHARTCECPRPAPDDDGICDHCSRFIAAALA